MASCGELPKGGTRDNSRKALHVTRDNSRQLGTARRNSAHLDTTLLEVASRSKIFEHVENFY